MSSQYHLTAVLVLYCAIAFADDSAVQFEPRGGHSRFISNIAVSPNERLIASMDDAGTICLWDSATGRQVRSFLSSEVYSYFDFDSKGNAIVLGSFGGVTNFIEEAWDVRTGSMIQTRNLTVASSTKQSLVATSLQRVVLGGAGCTAGYSDGEVNVRNTRNGNILLRTGPVSVETAFVTDGGLLVYRGVYAGSLDEGNAARLGPHEFAVFSFDSSESLGRETIFTGTQLPSPVIAGTGRDRLSVATHWFLNRIAVGDSAVALRDPGGFEGLVRRSKILQTSFNKKNALGPDLSARISPNGKYVAVQEADGWGAFELHRTDGSGNTLIRTAEDATAANFSQKGAFAVAFARPTRVELYKPSQIEASEFTEASKLVPLENSDYVYSSISLSEDGRYLWAGDTIWDVSNPKPIVVRRLEDVSHPGILTFSPGGKYATIELHDGLQILDAEANFSDCDRKPISLIEDVRFSPRDFDTFAVADASGEVTVWKVGEKDAPLHRFRSAGHATINAVEFSSDGRLLVGCGMRGDGRIWDLSNEAVVCEFVIRASGQWIVATNEGHFEVADVGQHDFGSFLAIDEPLRPLPPEIFMRTNYEPDLLGKLLRGEPLSEVPDLLSLNRVQPEVEILTVQPTFGDDSSVTVTVRVSGAERRIGAGETIRTDKTGVYDLRLFRDGQIVGQEPEEASDAALPILARTDAERKEWRTATQVCEPDGARTVKFEVALPRNRAGDEVEFSAYAFNCDRVKSETHRVKYSLPTSLDQVRPTAYVVSVGVDDYEGNAVANLNYAVADARLMLEAFGESFFEKDHYEVDETILVSARAGVSGGTPREEEELATKANVETAIGSLASATPDDAVILFFSGHGYTDPTDGKFYIFPRDLGVNSQRGDGSKPSKEVLDRCISSDDLMLWLRKVDAGEITLIVDTCHAAAAVEGLGDFKPGPMGSRGLGQLAYDKGMRVLAASQAGDVAIESSSIKHGLLTYALVTDGLRQKRAAINGQVTLGKLLSYGERRVPSLFSEILTGTLRGADGQAVTEAEPIISKAAKNAGEIRAGLTPVVQMPRLFQYSRDRDGPVLSTIPSAAEPSPTTKP